jgi:phosphoglycolate phosphatase
MMVGDSDVDFKTATAASVPIVLVSFGYGPVPQGEAGPDATVRHFSELAECAYSLLDRLTERGRRPVIGQNPAADRS